MRLGDHLHEIANSSRIEDRNIFFRGLLEFVIIDWYLAAIANLLPLLPMTGRSASFVTNFYLEKGELIKWTRAL